MFISLYLCSCRFCCLHLEFPIYLLRIIIIEMLHDNLFSLCCFEFASKDREYEILGEFKCDFLICTSRRLVGVVDNVTELILNDEGFKLYLPCVEV